MKQGIYDNFSNAAYHAEDGLNKSGITKLLKSPAHFKHSFVEQTPAMRLGTAVHTAILEPELFEKEYICAPPGDKRKKEVKEAWAELEKTGKIILPKSDIDMITGMCESVSNSQTARGLLMGGFAEHSVFWNDPIFGFKCKCRPDYCRPDLGYVIDVKTCQDASPEGFSKACANFGYDIQASWYLSGMNEVVETSYHEFIFLAIEKKPPYAVAVYKADATMIDRGHDKTRKALPIFYECKKTDTWPGYSDNIKTLRLPRWA